MRIIDSTNSADDSAFAGINDIAGITSDKTAIDNNPLFQLAEAYIVDLLPDAELRSTPVAGKGRTYPQRLSVISALQCLAGSNLLRGGGSVGGSSESDTTIERTGTLRSETEQIGPVSRTKNYSTSETSTESHRVNTEIKHESRADWLRDQAIEILKMLGASIETMAALGDPVALLTKSRLGSDECPEDGQSIGEMSYTAL